MVGSAQAASSGPRRRRLWGLGCARAVLGGGLVLAVAYVGTWWYAKARVGIELRRLRAAGVALSLAELAPPKVPDSENAAPLYVQAGALALQREPRNWREAKELPALSQEIERLHEALTLAREADRRPECRFDGAWARLADLDWTHLTRLRRLARFLQAAAVAASYEGDQAEACERLRIGSKAARALRSDPGRISMLVAVAMDAILRPAGEFVIDRGALPEPQARELAEEVAQVDYAAWLARSLRPRCASGIEQFAMLRRGEMRTPWGPGPIPRRERLKWWVYRRGVPAWLYFDELRFLRQVPEANRESASLSRDRPDQPLRGWMRTPPNEPQWAPMCKVLLHGRDVGQKAEFAAASRALFVAALGLQVHRQRHGTYPERLSELSDIDWPLCDDVFSGQPLRYRRTTTGYVLYSIGADLQDNGGTAPQRWQQIWDAPGYDITWPGPTTRL